MKLTLDRKGARGRGSGRARAVHVPPMLRGSSGNVGGLTPWGVGAGAPPIGAPLGRVQKEFGVGATFHCDPINWFQRAKLILTPSEFILGLPDLGKSTLIRKQIEWYDYTGVITLIPGDLKPDYVHLIRALGGQVLSLGVEIGCLNILDMGDAPAVAARLGKDTPAGRVLLANAKARRQTLVKAFITIQRGSAPADHEVSLLTAALNVLDTRWARSRKRNLPVLSDVLEVIQNPPEELRWVALDHGDPTEYKRTTRQLQDTLIALTMPGGLGDVFNKQSTIKMRRDISTVIDISAIDESDEKMRSAALVAGWAMAFNQVSVSNALADAGKEDQRRYFIVMDELWMALRQGKGMVDLVDSLSRLDRNKGVGVAKCSHTMADLEALASPEDRAKAAGLVERSGLVMLAGLPMAEMPRLETALRLTNAEQKLLSSWSTPKDWSADGNSRPPGQGLFLCKVGGRPGIPFETYLSASEIAVNNTNRRWSKRVTA